MRKDKFQDASWDIYHSTYIQQISLWNGKVFTGYSKKNDFAEKNDKQALLVNWIIRMHKVGYLDANHHEPRRKIDSIVYFINRYPAKQEVLKLKYDYYECLNAKWGFDNRQVIQFLDDFYEALKSGNTTKIKAMYIYKRTRYEDPFDLTAQRFITKKSLHEYCTRMLEQKKFSQEQAISYYHQYQEKFEIINWPKWKRIE